ncbi:MAG: NUDIX hydrolase [Clostridiales bacterium]|nr:NUDIX hydrolase [Clostridiales bacterium]
MDLIEKTVSQDYKYKGRIINLRVDDAELPNGEPCIREVVEHPGGVTVAALTDEDELIFVRQFRYPYGEVVLELPAGKLEPGEDPLSAGLRELEEEAGAVASKYTDLGKFYPSPGYCGEIIHMYGATGLTFTKQNLDEDEFLNVEKIPLNRAVEMVVNNEIRDGKTQAAVLKMAMLKWMSDTAE